ncbi:MAG: amidase [Paralcaligenes sp.]
MLNLQEDVFDSGIRDFALRLRRKQITSEAVTVEYLGRISVLDPRLTAFTQIVAEQALSTARSMDKLLQAGVDLGPLMGVPIAIKDLFSVAGMSTTAGSNLDVSHVVEPEGSFVTRLKRAGCVLLGKTRTTEFALGGINLIHRMPWNPWDTSVARTPGGSSHGSAVATSARLCAFSVGSDSGGSVRLPAALCGVFGYKASPGMWPADGIFPLSTTMDSIGIFTESAQDAAVVFAALSGQPEPQPRRLKGLRLGKPTNHFFDDLDSDVQLCMDRALAGLEREGVEIVPIEVPEVSEIDTVFARMVPAELLSTLGRECFLSGEGVIDPVAWSRAVEGLELSALEYIRLYRRHHDLCRIARERMRGLDGWVTPTTPGVPVAISSCNKVDTAAAWNKRATSLTRPGNLFGQCGVSLPIHMFGSALPVGLQVMCSSRDDALLLSIALGIEQAFGVGAKPDLSAFM